MKKIAFIGAGNIGAALIRGLLRAGQSPQTIVASDPDSDRLAIMNAELGISVTTDNHAAVAESDVMILAVKPQVISYVAASLRDAMRADGPLVVSVAAGTPTATLAHWLGGDPAVVRAMPNTPALIDCGATVLFANQQVSARQREYADRILAAVGTVEWLADESLMDVVTALSGNGPAYFFLLLETLQEAGEKLGLSTDMARRLALQTGFGACKMANESSEPPGALRSRVTSPGGTTEAAVAVLTEEGFQRLFENAFTAAVERGQKLGGAHPTQTEKQK